MIYQLITSVFRLKKELAIYCLFIFTILPTIANSQTFNTYRDLAGFFLYKNSSIPVDSALFPESLLTDRIETNFNRAHISWYVIDPSFYRYYSPIPEEFRLDPISREIYNFELYDIDNDLYYFNQTLNIAFYPKERSAYNFDVYPNDYSSGLDDNGFLLEPQTRWGGIQGPLYIDYYELVHYRYLGFWLMDPFVNNPESKGGDMYFNLGYISEDTYKDGVLANESKICSSYFCTYDSTAFGMIGHSDNTNSTFYFSNYHYGYIQDLGLDGLDDEGEAIYFSNYLDSVANKYGENSSVYNNVIEDPAGDNYQSYRRDFYPEYNGVIHHVYKDYQKQQNNADSDYPKVTIPDYEDLNKNEKFDTLNHYYQVKVSLKPNDLIVGQNYITEKKTYTFSSGNIAPVDYYKFLIPLDSLYWDEVGKGPDKIRTNTFRIFLHGFYDSVILRFPEIALVANDLDHYKNVGNFEETVTLYPNPCSVDIITVLIANGTLKVAEVCNELGQLIISKETNNNGIYLDVSTLLNGIYFVRLITENKIHTKKIVISKY
jgi:cell surface protein SprA